MQAKTENADNGPSASTETLTSPCMIPEMNVAFDMDAFQSLKQSYMPMMTELRGDSKFGDPEEMNIEEKTHQSKRSFKWEMDRDRA